MNTQPQSPQSRSNRRPARHIRQSRAAGFVLLIAFTLLMFAGESQAQPSVGAQFAVGVPMGEFGDRLDGSVGFGFSGQGLYRIPGTPVSIGGNLGFVMYGQETLRTPFGSGPLGRVEVDVVTSNNLTGFHALLRLQMPTGMLRPYADGLIGANYLFTESRIQDVSGQRPEIASTTNFDDFSFSYGGGVGLQVTLLEQVSETGHQTELALDIGLRYIEGGRADYLRRGSIREGEDGGLEYDVIRSRTSLLIPQIGVTFRL